MNAPKSADQLYGFTDYMNPKQGIPNDDDQNYQQSAMQTMRIDSMMNELVSLGDVHGNAPNRMFENQINYGSQPGGIQVVVSPYGSLKIQIRSLVNDNLGNPSYILRKCIPLVNDFNHFKTKIGEEAVAGYVYDQALKFSKMKLEYPIPKYNDLETLIKYLAARLREQHPLIMMYAATYRENDNYYTIHFDFRGQGVEAPGGTPRKVLEFVTHLSFNPQTGMLRSWGNDVSTPMNKTNWEIQPSEWDELFCPSQDKKDITENIVYMLSTY